MINRNENLEYANTHDIFIDQRIINHEILRGIYGIFDNEECLYTGRSNNLYYRILKANGHIAKMRLNQHVGKVMSAVHENRRIDIRLLEEVKLVGDNPARDAQRLASRECFWIDLFQARGECLEQFPEGPWRE